MKKSIGVLLIVLVIVGSLVGCGSSDKGSEETFETFKSEEGKFSIDFPGKPEESVQSAMGLDINIVALEDGDTAYTVLYSDYPEEIVKASKPEDMLAGGVQGQVASLGGEVVESKDITLDDYPGKHLVVETEKEGTKVNFNSKIFLVGNRLYQIQAINVDNENLDKFFDSFELVK